MKSIIFLLSCLSINIIANNNISSNNNAANQPFDRSHYYGRPVFDSNNKLQYVVENETHNSGSYIVIKVTNIKKTKARSVGRIRVALWDNKNNFAKEGVKPFRAISHWAKDTNDNNEMIFKIGGLTKGKSYAFFAHFDESNSGSVAKNFLGIPKDQFIFSNAKNKGTGPGLTREGLSPPKFENTLVMFTNEGQEIVLPLK